MGSIPGQGAKISYALRSKTQNTKQKQYCNKLNKDFKIGPHKKILNETDGLVGWGSRFCPGVTTLQSILRFSPVSSLRMNMFTGQCGVVL